jgi:Tol biopolymer transport system component
MATGKLAFYGNTQAVIFEALLNKIPTLPTRIEPDLNPELERIILRSMEKDRDLRYQSASDLRADLKRVKRDSSSGKSVTVAAAATATTKPFAFNRWLKILVPLLFLIAAGFLIFKYSTPKSKVLPNKLHQISQWNKMIYSAAISRDGKTIAFTSPVNETPQVFVMLSSGGEPLQLTNEPGNKYVSSFTADGKEILYVRESLSETWAVPALGGIKHRLTSAAWTIPSHDGKSYFCLKNNDHGIFQASEIVAEEKLIHTLKSDFPFGILPYDDDRNILVVAAGFPQSEKRQLFRVNLLTHAEESLGDFSQGRYVELQSPPIWWEVGKSLLITRNINDIMNLWKYDLDTHSYTQVSFGAGPDILPMPDQQEEKIYFVSGKRTGTLITYDVKTQKQMEISSTDSSQPVISPNLKKVMYLKYLPNGMELWISEINGMNPIRIAEGLSMNAGEWSPDSLHVHFISYTADEGKLNTADVNGQKITPIWSFQGAYRWSIYSSDGKSIYFTTDVQGHYTIWNIKADGSRAEKFIDPGFAVTDTTSDGKYLFGTSDRNEICQASVDEKRMTKISDASESSFIKKSEDGKSILYIVRKSDETIIYRHKWSDGRLIGKPEIAVRLPFVFDVSYGGAGCDFTRNLSMIVYSKPNRQDDIYMLSK